MDNFKDAPKSVAEIRAEKEDNATKWTPRDALVCMLREIDNGMNVNAMVICYRIQKPDDKPHQYQPCYYVAGGHGPHDALGLVTRIGQMLTGS